MKTTIKGLGLRVWHMTRMIEVSSKNGGSKLSGPLRTLCSE